MLQRQSKLLKSILTHNNGEFGRTNNFQTFFRKFSDENAHNKLSLQTVKNQILTANDKYETFIGLTDVKYAQESVQRAENMFLEARIKERSIMRSLLDTRDKLKHIREELSQVKYSSPTYLQLANKQHELVNEEERLNLDLQNAEEEERTHFMNLSNAMRESYEKERIRVEKTKNWSLIGTVLGGLIGMFGSIYMNRTRTKDLVKVVSNKNDAVLENLSEFTNTIKKEQEDVVKNLSKLKMDFQKIANEQEMQNIRAMAGFVNDVVNEDEEISGTEAKLTGKQFNPKVFEDIKEELTNYNIALKCIVNSVNNLAAASSISSKAPDRQTDPQNVLQNSEDILQYLNTITDQLMSLYELCAKDIQPTLSQIETGLMNSDNGKNNVELNKNPLEESPQSNHVKAALLWGTFFSAIYFFIKV